MAAVALLNAEAGSAPSRTGSFSYFSNARVVVENLAFDKIVGIWGHNPASGNWGFFPCTFDHSVPNNGEIWRAHIDSTEIDAARLGSPLRRARDRRAVQPLLAGAFAQAERRADGFAEGDRAARARPGGGPGRTLADHRSVPGGDRALGRRLQRDRDVAIIVVARPVASQDSPDPPADQPEGARGLQKRGFAARLSEIVEAHPEAEGFEIWSQDEARVGQTGRTGYIWWQRGHTPAA